MYDVAVVGAGMAGMATAARLQARGLKTIVLEAHGQAGGCAGFFRRRNFAFDVGATTLVDFEPGGVGGELLADIGMTPLHGEVLPGYRAWLPDRVVNLYRDHTAWAVERLRMLGDSPAHRKFWRWMDCLAAVFWQASRAGIRLPVRGVADVWHALRCTGWRNLPLLRYLGWTVGDALRACRLREDKPIVGLLSMLLEDTVHAAIDEAPLINGALGITIRGAGLSRCRGGMFGFWSDVTGHFRTLGGVLRVGCPVYKILANAGNVGYRLLTRRGDVSARQVVSALPVALTAMLAPRAVTRALQPYLERDRDAQGGAVAVFLGVPESEVSGQAFTHHQLLQDYQRPLGHGNNMFISVSAAGDTASAPPGHRAVMISTHCRLDPWEGLCAEEYARRKATMGMRLVKFARRVYPELGRRALVYEVATPRTYERFTRRPRGAVGGVRQTLGNANQHSVPHDIGVPGIWLVGDTTWPGLGTVACALGSRLVADRVLAHAPRALGGGPQPNNSRRAEEDRHEPACRS